MFVKKTRNYELAMQSDSGWRTRSEIYDTEGKYEHTGWRRGWDSNPRLSFPNTRFPSVLLKPLGHLSA